MQFTVDGHRLDVDTAVLDAPDERVRREVEAYLAGERREFSVAVDYPDGFTGDVMRAMAAIPYGETRTYGDLADDLDTGAVAVGQACGSNPTPMVVPCHRVVGADSLGGFSAAGGVEAKRALLDLERGQRQTDLGAFE
ncbi:methylated-DNA--[protein]-cysteine S-methyltransferase [Halospeciosus flavus]|uniref:Methylated-DNA--[protein]-cysteine S-methyltransferase n=1 Tax=Halospeciosus flavus TaxID=3032283 RepID=A0ABD5Z1B7_9EURY|nr:methylated-DNA--[protein]-cysteine S-methyltransferase [Halospeciosus flavus]